MTTVWFDSNYNEREKHEPYRPGFYASYCDTCETLLTNSRNRSIHEEKEELQEQLIQSKCFVAKPKSYKDFRHFCNRSCEDLYVESKTNARIQKNIAAAALEAARKKPKREYED